ncbi:alpha/beta hydrolase [soil metagenome]
MIPYSELASTTAPPADHRIAYGAHPLQFGELRLPAGSGRVPVVVFIHGGCWRAQYDLAHVASASSALAADGYATWTIEYRRLGDVGGGWPGTFEDVALAVDHVRSLAAQFPRLDTTRVVLMGHSAGGQLAVWAASRTAADASGPLQQAGPPLAVAGVVSLAGITDLAQYGATSSGCNGAVTPLMGGDPSTVPDRYRAVSPVERVPLRMPVRLVHGDADAIVPVAQSRDFDARNRAAGGASEVFVIAGAGHFDLVAPSAEAWATVLRALHAISGRASGAGNR